jgi:hypothetical protein
MLKILLGICITLVVALGSNGFHIVSKLAVNKPGISNKTICSANILSRGGHLLKPSAANTESIISNGLVRKVSVVFASVVDPVITGGLLSGGLHAVSGKYRVARCVFFWDEF